MLLLVRHGLTPTTGREMPEAGAGPGLSEDGRKQAEEAGRHISSWRGSLPPIAALYCSPLSRTRETAGVVGKVLDLTPVERADLVDCNAGDWAGTPLKDLAKKPEWPTVMHYPSGFCFPGGEAIRDMQARMVAAVHDLVKAYPGKTVLVVSHADPIKSVLADALGAHLDLFQRIVVSPGSVSAISYGGTSPSVVLVNWTGPGSQAPKLPAPDTKTEGRS
jgi:probable phosphomutase (TIGR03848 family)